MVKNRLAFIAAHFADCKVRFSENKNFLEIRNSIGNDNINVEYEGNSCEECTVSFSFQQRDNQKNITSTERR